jgi:hypothetical protein
MELTSDLADAAGSIRMTVEARKDVLLHRLWFS